MDKQIWRMLAHEACDVADVSDAFLSPLVAELDNEQVTAPILKGSCACGEETVYSGRSFCVLNLITPFIGAFTERDNFYWFSS